jgi:hypothetical protein
MVEEDRIMSQVITLTISDSALKRAEEIAANTRRDLESVLSDWIDSSAHEPVIESMSNTEVLALANFVAEGPLQDKLDELVAQEDAGYIAPAGQVMLNEITSFYRRMLVRKAYAIKIATERGLLQRQDRA